MPIYEYACAQCGHVEEVIQKVSDAALTTCPVCSGPYAKLISAPAFQFKGSGFYETDYKRSTHSGGSSAGDSGSDETKTAASTDKKSSPTTGTPKKESLVS